MQGGLPATVLGVEASLNGGDGWRRENLRVSRPTFDNIVNILERASRERQGRIPASNAFVNMRMRVAITLAYLASEGTFRSTAKLFGIAKSTVISNVNEILDLLVDISPTVVRFPCNSAEWQRVAANFEAIAGFPDVGGAIDGTLFEIERPFFHDGWYTRKRFPGIKCKERSTREGDLWSTPSDQGRAATKTCGEYAVLYCPRACTFLVTPDTR